MSQNFKAVVKQSPEALMAGLLTGGAASTAAAVVVLKEARACGLSLQAYLSVAADPSLSADTAIQKMNPMQAIYAAARLPSNTATPEAQITLAASSDSFATNPGLSILVPAIVENIIRQKGVEPPMENVNDFIAQSRQVAGVEVITKGVWSGNDSDTFEQRIVSEGAQIAKRSINATQTNVKFWKLGSALEFTYEAARRMTPDMLVPFLNRMEDQRQRDRAAGAVYILMNGDAGHDAITQVRLDDAAYGGTMGSLSSNAAAFLRFLISRAKVGRTANTIAANYDTVAELMLMFPVNQGSNGVLATGVNASVPNQPFNISLPGGLRFSFKVAISTEVPEGAFIAFDKNSTLEELIETGSQISEQEKAISNQMITYVNTLDSGFKFAVDESRILVRWKV